MSRHEHIVEAALAATSDLCVDVLGFPAPDPTPKQPTETSGKQLVSVALVNDSVAVQIGLSADRPGCAELVRTMLGAAPSDAMDPQDVVDAISEAVNIMAGNFKTRVNETYRSLKLGLPLITSDNSGDAHAKWVTFIRKPLAIGPHTADLVVIVDDRSIQ